MLDKRTTHFLFIIAKICDDGSYKIIEKTELQKEMRVTDFSELNQMVRYLQDNEMIDVKYSDELVICLTVLPKGRATVEGTRIKARSLVKIDYKTLLIVAGVCFLASLFGSMIGALLASLM